MDYEYYLKEFIKTRTEYENGCINYERGTGKHPIRWPLPPPYLRVKGGRPLFPFDDPANLERAVTNWKKAVAWHEEVPFSHIIPDVPPKKLSQRLAPEFRKPVGRPKKDKPKMPYRVIVRMPLTLAQRLNEWSRQIDLSEQEIILGLIDEHAPKVTIVAFEDAPKTTFAETSDA